MGEERGVADMSGFSEANLANSFQEGAVQV